MSIRLKDLLDAQLNAVPSGGAITGQNAPACICWLRALSIKNGVSSFWTVEIKSRIDNALDLI